MKRLTPTLQKNAKRTQTRKAKALTLDGARWLVTDGGVTPRERPGFGVDLYHSALRRCAELFREKGERTYFDED